MGVLAVGGWVVAAALTVGVSWSAISVVQDSVVPRTEVRSALPAPSERPAASTPAPTGPRPSGTPAARVVVKAGQGGTATVRCSGGVPTFVNLTPRQGYTVRRDDSSAEVEFSSPDHRTGITATCSGGTPQVSVEEKGGRGGSGRGGGNDD